MGGLRRLWLVGRKLGVSYWLLVVSYLESMGAGAIWGTLFPYFGGGTEVLKLGFFFICYEVS